MTEDDGSPIFERGDVVLGADPFKGDVAARPWVIVSNHEGGSSTASSTSP